MRKQRGECANTRRRGKRYYVELAPLDRVANLRIESRHRLRAIDLDDVDRRARLAQASFQDVARKVSAWEQYTLSSDASGDQGVPDPFPIEPIRD